MGKELKNTANVTYTDPEGNKLGVGSMDAYVTYSSPKISFYTTIEKDNSGFKQKASGKYKWYC